MQPKQRVAKPRSAFESADRVWVPYMVRGPSGGRRPEVDVQPGDHYASVDDVADGMVVFSVSGWPLLDREGRLFWDTSPVELVAPEPEAQTIVNAGRAEAGITAPDRSIRVGDVFLVRGLPKKPASLDQASLVLDISAAARDAARAALYGAVAPTLPTKIADRQQYEEPEPDAGYFDVRQRRRVERPGGGGAAS